MNFPPSIVAHPRGLRWLHAMSLCAALSGCDSDTSDVFGSPTTATATSDESSQTDGTGSTSSADTGGGTTTATSTTTEHGTTGPDSAGTTGASGSTGAGLTGDETGGEDAPFGCHGFCHNVVDCDPNFAGSLEGCVTTCYEPFERQTEACQVALELTNECIAALDCAGYLEWATANLELGYPCDMEESLYFQECSF